jgi:hypothetical protein
MECFRQAQNGEIGARTRSTAEADQYPRVALMMFCAADLPLSLVGDIVTWPYTAAYSFINQPIPLPPLVQVPPAPVGAPPVPVQGPPPTGPQAPAPDFLPEPMKLP